MLSSERVRTILEIALPIVGGMISQNLLNLVDLAMVGVLGPIALAAVGIGGFVTMAVATLLVGIASGGVQPLAARRSGEGRTTETAVPLNGGLLLALGLGLPASAVAVWLTPLVFPYISADPLVVADGAGIYPPIRHRRR